MAKMQPDMYVGGKGGEQACGFEEEHGNAKQGTGVKAASKSGERVASYGDSGLKTDEPLFHGLTRGSEAPMPFQNPSGIGDKDSSSDVMRIISEGKGPMEGEYNVYKVGSSQAGEKNPIGISGDGSRT